MTDTATDTRWLPVTRDDKSAPFYDAASRRALLLRRCASCEQWLTPEATICSACGGVDLAWAEATGRGTLVTWTVVHRPPIPAFADHTPYLLGLVELEEGPWLYSRLLDADHTTWAAGTAVSVAFVHPDGSESYPVFTAG